MIENYRKTRKTHSRGTRAAQPAATEVLDGTLYFVTDEGIIEQSNGTIWQSFSGTSGGSGSQGLRGFNGLDGIDGENTEVLLLGSRYNSSLPGGSNTQVQFNDSGTLSGAIALLYDKTGALVGIGITPSGAKLRIENPAGASNDLALLVNQSDNDQAVARFQAAGTDILVVNYNATNDGLLQIKAGGVTKVSLNANGSSAFDGGGISTVGLLDLSAAAAGQVKFPATQNPSSNANTFDDYKEIDVTLTDNSGAGLSITNNRCFGIKKGQDATIYFDITYPATVNGASASLAGLPFLSKAGGGASPSSVSIGYNGSAIAVSGYVQQNSTTMFFYSSTGGTPITNAQLSGATLRGVMIYYTNS